MNFPWGLEKENWLELNYERITFAFVSCLFPQYRFFSCGIASNNVRSYSNNTPPHSNIKQLNRHQFPSMKFFLSVISVQSLATFTAHLFLWIVSWGRLYLSQVMQLSCFVCFILLFVLLKTSFLLRALFIKIIFRTSSPSIFTLAFYWLVSRKYYLSFAIYYSFCRSYLIIVASRLPHFQIMYKYSIIIIS